MKMYLSNLMWIIIGLISLPLWWVIAAAVGLIWLIWQAVVQLHAALFTIDASEPDVENSTLTLD